MIIFRHAVFGDGLVERGEVAFGTYRTAIVEGLHDALAVVILKYDTFKAAAKRDGCFKLSDS